VAVDNATSVLDNIAR